MEGSVSRSLSLLTLHLVCVKHVLGAQGEDRPTFQVTVSTPGPPSALIWSALGLPERSQPSTEPWRTPESGVSFHLGRPPVWVVYELSWQGTPAY